MDQNNYVSVIETILAELAFSKKGAALELATRRWGDKKSNR
jgi:hypothetical protein